MPKVTIISRKREDSVAQPGGEYAAFGQEGNDAGHISLAGSMEETVRILRNRLTPDSILPWEWTDKRKTDPRVCLAFEDGCIDSWWVGGNYGFPKCTNPEHHDMRINNG